jgi:hypothetical protein
MAHLGSIGISRQSRVTCHSQHFFTLHLQHHIYVMQPPSITNIYKCFTARFGCLYNLDYCFRFAVGGEVTIGAIRGLYPSMGNTLVKSADEAKMSGILDW